jgi:hypothetical protein
MRTFRDPAGIEWTVFEVKRTNDENWAYLPRGFRSGWLCFESVKGKRRLSPVPDGWRTADEGDLEQMLKRAAPVGRAKDAGDGLNLSRDRDTEANP